jgi:adenylosuccinate synthase
MTLQVIVGGQFGSEGKGAIAAHLAKDSPDLFAVRVAGPNAGHTVIGRCPSLCTDAVIALTDSDSDPAHGEVRSGRAHYADQHPWRLRQVPVAAVANPAAFLGIAPGSEIDPEVLFNEVQDLDDAGYNASQRLFIDPRATVITAEDKMAESDDQGAGLPARIGSTGKGIGAARASRIMRTAMLAEEWEGWPCGEADIGLHIRQRMAGGGDVQIEGTQGYGLGLHAGFYPHCTSSDCTALDFLAMAGAPPWMIGKDDLDIWVVFRTFPIRVAGNSGPLRNETTWEEVGQPEEYTTVTRKVRRVGGWDPVLARQAMEANGHWSGASNVRAALTMADYVVPGLAGLKSLQELPGDHEAHDQFDQLVARYSHDIGSLIRLVGTGPDSVIDLRQPGAYSVYGIGSGKHHRGVPATKGYIA